MLHLVAVMRDDRLNYQQDKTKGTPVNSFRHSISCHCCSVYLTPPTNKPTLWSRARLYLHLGRAVSRVGHSVGGARSGERGGAGRERGAGARPGVVRVRGAAGCDRRGRRREAGGGGEWRRRGGRGQRRRHEEGEGRPRGDGGRGGGGGGGGGGMALLPPQSGRGGRGRGGRERGAGGRAGREGGAWRRGLCRWGGGDSSLRRQRHTRSS